MVALLHRREERVEVDMEDRPDQGVGGHGRIFAPFVNGREGRSYPGSETRLAAGGSPC